MTCDGCGKEVDIVHGNYSGNNTWIELCNACMDKKEKAMKERALSLYGKERWPNNALEPDQNRRRENLVA